MTFAVWGAMWKELIREINSEWRLLPPASAADLEDAETALQLRLPNELSSLLAETDGVLDKYGAGAVWPARRIRDDNLFFRSYPDFAELYMPFDPLLFFSDAGNGDQFAFRILANAVRDTDIYVWDHKNDSRTWVAPSLRIFLDWLNTGKIRF